jgi:hypothetical protein
MAMSVPCEGLKYLFEFRRQLSKKKYEEKEHV